MTQFINLLVFAFAKSHISIVSLSRVRFSTVSCCKRAMTASFRMLSLLDLKLLLLNIVIEVCLLVVAAVLLRESVWFGCWLL